MKIGSKTFKVEEAPNGKMILRDSFKTVRQIQNYFNQYGWVFGSGAVISIDPVSIYSEILGGIQFVSGIDSFMVTIEVEGIKNWPNFSN